MRPEETSNARSLLGYSAVDVKRFSAAGQQVCRERYEGLAARVPDRKLHVTGTRFCSAFLQPFCSRSAA